MDVETAEERDTLPRAIAAVLGCDPLRAWADAWLHDNGCDHVEGGIETRRRKGRQEGEKQE